MPKKKVLDIAFPLDSLLLRGVSGRSCFCLRARYGLKAGLGLTPCSNRLSNGTGLKPIKKIHSDPN